MYYQRWCLWIFSIAQFKLSVCYTLLNLKNERNLIYMKIYQKDEYKGDFRQGEENINLPKLEINWDGVVKPVSPTNIYSGFIIGF